jgi:hypothetical protein
MCRAKADCELKLRNKAMLRDFEIPISVLRGHLPEETRQIAKLANNAIGGLWFLDDQHFVHGWLYLNDGNFTALWDQVLHGKYTSCHFNLRVDPVQNDVWTGDDPLSITTASINFHRSPTSDKSEGSQAGLRAQDQEAGKGGITVLARLGHVLGWTGNIIGGLLVSFWIYTMVAIPDPQGLHTFARGLFLLLPGIVIFLLGRALKHIFAGPNRSN